MITFKPFLPSGVTVTTTQLTVSYVRPAAVGDHLTARGEVVHLGRRTASLTVRMAGAALNYIVLAVMSVWAIALRFG